MRAIPSPIVFLPARWQLTRLRSRPFIRVSNMSMFYNVTDRIGWAFIELCGWLHSLCSEDGNDLRSRVLEALGSASYSVGNWFYGVRP